jgi:DNA-directed RNA polymerase subunit N (RpoN/RPB10)
MTIEGQADFTKDFLNRVAAAMSGQIRRSLTMMEMCCRRLMLLSVSKNNYKEYM